MALYLIRQSSRCVAESKIVERRPVICISPSLCGHVEIAIRDRFRLPGWLHRPNR